MLSCRKQLSLKRNLFTVHVSCLEWNCFLQPLKCYHCPPPMRMLLRPFTSPSPHLVFQLQTRPTSKEDPECDIAGEPTHHAPLGPWSHVSRHDPSNRYALAFNPRFLVVVAKALMSHTVAFFPVASFLTPTHMRERAPTHMPSLPTSSLPAACPRNGSQSKVTHAPNHQTPTAHPFTKNRSSAQSPQTRSRENKLKWRSFLSD